MKHKEPAIARLLWIVFLTLFLCATQAAHADELLDRIRALPGVASVHEGTSTVPGARFFLIKFRQPVDHNHLEGPRFLQRMTLVHRSETAPMVLLLNGYFIRDVTVPVVKEITAYFQANQLHVEHRQFCPSCPKPMYWKYLRIAQSAADDHRIVESFRQLYTGKWVSTGYSKGGMTSVYHRYYYPEDVDGTVAYVAPSSHGTSDERYIDYVNSRGSAECRRKLHDFQLAVLRKRGQIQELMTGASFEIVGKDRALEFDVQEMPFAFWQYWNAYLCEVIPRPDASPGQLYGFLNRVYPLAHNFGDQSLRQYAPYFYQAAVELGSPAIDEASLSPHLNYPGQDYPAAYPPRGIPKEFDPAIMPAVEAWVLHQGKNFMFIYGRNDPWSAGAYRVRAGNKSYRFFVEGLQGNHGASISQLPSDKRAQVLSIIARWLDVPAPVLFGPNAGEVTPLFDPPTWEELFLR